MTIAEIQSYIEEIENNSLLYEEKNFDKRIEVIDAIEFQVLNPIEELLQRTAQPNQLRLLKSRAEKVKGDLNEIDTKLFQRLRENIRAKGFNVTKFKNLINKTFDFNLGSREHSEEIGYDNLDIIINGLLHIQPMPKQTIDLDPEMVYYQKTPARIVFKLVDQCRFIRDDVFFDLGSGLGQVAILINLLTGVKAKGVEIEPAFCDYADNCTRELNLSNVTFINVDARKADYSEGTIFFMFTPFKGKILQQVLDLLRKESQLRKIKIITYGPCTAEVALQNWLDFVRSENDNIYKLSVFNSF